MKKQAQLYKEYLDWIEKEKKRESITFNYFFSEWDERTKMNAKKYREIHGVEPPLLMPPLFIPKTSESMEGFYHWLIGVKYKGAI